MHIAIEAAQRDARLRRCVEQLSHAVDVALFAVDAQTPDRWRTLDHVTRCAAAVSEAARIARAAAHALEN